MFEVQNEVVERKNLRQMIVFYEVKAAPFHNRTFLSSFVWQKVSDTPLTFVFVTAPIELHDKVPPEREAHAVRAEGWRCFRLTRIGGDLTKVQKASSVDLKGHFPRSLTNTRVIPNLVRQRNTDVLSSG
jgi:hypothetical protein